MRVVFVYIWRAWFIVLGVILSIILGPFIYTFSLSEKYAQQCYFLVRIWCKGMFYGMGFRYELIVEASKKIEKDRQYIIIANHTSIIDVFLSCILHSEHLLFFVGKKELEKIPIFGTIYKRVVVTVDRKDSKSRAEVYIKCAERIKKGRSMVIFPEGGVTDDLSIILQDFKNGAFNMAIEHKIPILVYTFIDLKYMFPFDNSKGYPSKVKVYFNDILEPAIQDAEKLKEKAWDLINNTLQKHI